MRRGFAAWKKEHFKSDWTTVPSKVARIRAAQLMARGNVCIG